MSDLVYLYAILPAEGPALAALRRGELRGLADAPVTAVVEGGLAAAVSAVPAEEFEAEALNRLVRDLDWLGPRAERHQEVTARLMELTEALLPLAFGTVFRGTAPVAQLLREQGAELTARLAALRGRAEWVLTVRRESEAALAALDASPALQALRRDLAGASPGRAYLLSRRLEAARREELAAQDAHAAEAATAALLPLAERAEPEAVADEGRQGLLLRLTALVERVAEPRWLAAAADLERAWRPQGYEVRVSGPWPPYRFSAAAADGGRGPGRHGDGGTRRRGDGATGGPGDGGDRQPGDRATRR